MKCNQFSLVFGALEPRGTLIGTINAGANGYLIPRLELIRAIQAERLAPFGLHANARMAARHIRRFCLVDDQVQRLLAMVTDRLGLSARSYSRILKVGRTIADLAGSEAIRQEHLAEAIQYRGLDRRTQ